MRGTVDTFPVSHKDEFVPDIYLQKASRKLHEGGEKSRRRRRERLRRNCEGENFCILCPKYIIIGLVRDFITVIMNEKNPNNYFP